MVPHLLLDQKDPAVLQDHWDLVVLMDLVDQVILVFLRVLVNQLNHWCQAILFVLVDLEDQEFPGFPDFQKDPLALMAL